MPRTLATAAALAFMLGAGALPAQAALDVGDKAPDFTLDAALGGNAFKFSLASALKQGPVVLYFFPKAFTQGCTLEAHAFAEASPQFATLGARVVGMSHDNIATLQRFSSEACRDQFAVASDPQARTIQAYDASAAANPARADRISYVIAPSGKIVFVHAGADPLEHVQQTLAAVQRLQRGAGK